ncbi:MAG: hypothetical protein WBM00_08850 [Solirubrobacterales bacterium]
MLEQLIRAEVRFVLIGGLAVNAWGYVRGTGDVDIVPDPSAENLAKLDAVLKRLNGKVEGPGGLLAPEAISTFLKAGDRTLVTTDLGHVDILQGHPQVPAFAALDSEATDVEMDGLVVRVCSLEHLVSMKRASERARDRDDIEALEAAQRTDAETD